jgi:HAD superfamily hydrolase (TIGR01509 family)
MFDLDGTLVDSLDCYHSVFLDTFGQMGLPIVEKVELMELMRHGRNILDTLIPVDWPERDAAKEECRKVFRDLWTERSVTAIRLHEEGEATLRTLHRQGLRLGLATAAQGPWIVRLLEANGILQLFAAVVTYADVSVRKPAPDLLLTCLKQIGGEAQRSVYVGDSPIDIIAAKAAGVHSIGVLSGASDRASLEEVEPELILDHVGQLPAVLRTEELGR